MALAVLEKQITNMTCITRYPFFLKTVKFGLTVLSLNVDDGMKEVTDPQVVGLVVTGLH